MKKRSTLFVRSLSELKAADATDKGIAGRNGMEGGVMLSKITVKIYDLGQQQQKDGLTKSTTISPKKVKTMYILKNATTFFFILIEQVWIMS
jgi:hypothetical protein